MVSTAHELHDDPALVPTFVVVLAAVDVVGAEAEHAVDEAGELMGGGGDGLGRAEAGLQAAMEGAEGGAAVVEGTGREAERGGRAAGRRFGAAAALLTAGAVAAGREDKQVKGSDAVLALLSLGFRQVEAQKAVREVLSSLKMDDIDTEELVRRALKLLA